MLSLCSLGSKNEKLGILAISKSTTKAKWIMVCSTYLADWQHKMKSLDERGRAAATKLGNRLDAAKGGSDWSAGQILEHMRLANLPYLTAMAKAVAGAPTSTQGEAKLTWFGKMLVRASGPSGNFPAPKQLHPSAGPFGQEIVNTWSGQNHEFLRIAEHAKGTPLSQVKLRNPFFPIFPMNLVDCFEVIEQHTERHVGQIEKIADRETVP